MIPIYPSSLSKQPEAQHKRSSHELPLFGTLFRRLSWCRIMQNPYSTTIVVRYIKTIKSSRNPRIPRNLLSKPTGTQEESTGDGLELCISYVYEPSSLHDAWRFLSGLSVDDEEIALDGLTQLEGIHSLDQLRELPKTLQTLSFSPDFSESLERLQLPSSLRSRGIGAEVVSDGRDLDKETIPAPSNRSPIETSQGLTTLQRRTGGGCWYSSFRWRNHPRTKVYGLRHFSRSNCEIVCVSRSLTFGKSFNQRLERVTWPSGLQHLTFGKSFNQTLDGVTWPPSLQSISFAWSGTSRKTSRGART